MRRLIVPGEAARLAMDCAPEDRFVPVAFGVVASVVLAWRTDSAGHRDPVGTAAELARRVLARPATADRPTMATLVARLVDEVLDSTDLRLVQAGRDEVATWTSPEAVDPAAVGRLRGHVRACPPRPTAHVGFARTGPNTSPDDARTDVGLAAAAALRRLGLDVAVDETQPHPDDWREPETVLEEASRTRAADLAVVVLSEGGEPDQERRARGRPDALPLALGVNGHADVLLVDDPADAMVVVTGAVHARRARVIAAAAARLLGATGTVADDLTEAEWAALDSASELGRWHPSEAFLLPVRAQVSAACTPSSARRRFRHTDAEAWERLHARAEAELLA